MSVDYTKPKGSIVNNDAVDLLMEDNVVCDRLDGFSTLREMIR